MEFMILFFYDFSRLSLIRRFFFSFTSSLAAPLRPRYHLQSVCLHVGLRLALPQILFGLRQIDPFAQQLGFRLRVGYSRVARRPVGRDIQSGSGKRRRIARHGLVDLWRGLKI